MKPDPGKAVVGALAVSALLTITALPASSQDRPEGETVFTGEAHVLAVEVPVQVLVDGEPVRGLGADDFRIYEGGEPRSLTGFEVVDLSVSATGAAGAADAAVPAALSVPPAGRRHFLLFFGLAFTEGEDLPRAIDGARSLAVGLEDVLERTRVTYLLTFQTESVPEDGAFHPIRVELAGGPRGAELVHRAGYHAPRPSGEREPFELRAEAAARLLAGDEVGGLPASVRATALTYSAGVARAAGEPVASGGLRILGQRPPEAGQPDLLVALLDPGALDPGDYRLEVALAGTGQRVTAPFRVGG